MDAIQILTKNLLNKFAGPIASAATACDTVRLGLCGIWFARLW